MVTLSRLKQYLRQTGESYFMLITEIIIKTDKFYKISKK